MLILREMISKLTQIRCTSNGQMVSTGNAGPIDHSVISVMSSFEFLLLLASMGHLGCQIFRK